MLPAPATGYEPRGLFNVCEFVMNNREGAGSISLEEALTIMYLRHGRAELDAKLEEVFGTSDLNSGKTLSLTEFLSCLHQHQVGFFGGLAAAASKKWVRSQSAGCEVCKGSDRHVVLHLFRSSSCSTRPHQRTTSQEPPPTAACQQQQQGWQPAADDEDCRRL